MTSSLRLPIIANALFSLASGVLLAVAPETVTTWLGLDIAPWLRLFGLALICHFAILAGSLPRLGEQTVVRLNLPMIAPYPLILLLCVLFGLIEEPLGQALALFDGAVVAAFAVGQWLGLRSHSRSENLLNA